MRTVVETRHLIVGQMQVDEIADTIAVQCHRQAQEHVVLVI